MSKTVLQFLDNGIFFSKRFHILFFVGLFRPLKVSDRSLQRNDLFLIPQDSVFQFCDFRSCLFKVEAQIASKFDYRTQGAFPKALEMDAHTFSYDLMVAFKVSTSDCRDAISASFSDIVFWRSVILAEAIPSSVVVTFLEDDVLPRRPEEGISSPVSESSVPKYFLLGLDCLVTGS